MSSTLRQRTKLEIMPYLPKAFIGHYQLCRKHVSRWRAFKASSQLTWVMFKTAPNKI